MNITINDYASGVYIALQLSPVFDFFPFSPCTINPLEVSGYLLSTAISNCLSIMMNINQDGYGRRMVVVQEILQHLGLNVSTFSSVIRSYSVNDFRILKPSEVTPLAYVENCPFHFNNFIYKVSLESPALPANFPGRQIGTSKPPLGGAADLVIRLSNPHAEGLNNTNRVENEVASLYLARDSLQKSGVAPVVPVVYAWSPSRFHDTPNEEGFGWIVTEFKKGSDLDAQFPELSLEEKTSVIKQIADVLSAIQRAQIPASAPDFGALTFVNGQIVSGQMPLVKGGPWKTYSSLWVAKLRAQLVDSEQSPLLQGWKIGGIRERLEMFLTDGVNRFLEGADVTQKVLVHGDLSTFTTPLCEKTKTIIAFLTADHIEAMNNILYDRTTQLITGVLDFDWSSITHPADEFLTGLWDIGGGFHENNEFMQDSILSGNFDIAPLGLSNEDLQKWELARIWNKSLAERKAIRPSKIKGLREIEELGRLESMLCPFHLSNEVMLQRTTEEVQVVKKAESEENIRKWLDVHGF